MSDNDTALSPQSLVAMSGAYWRSCTLHAGVALDVFTPLAEARPRPRTWPDAWAAMRAPWPCSCTPSAPWGCSPGRARPSP
jgi:hypothetical protein